MKYSEGINPDHIAFAYRDYETTHRPVITHICGKDKIEEFFKSARLGGELKKKILSARKLGYVQIDGKSFPETAQEYLAGFRVNLG